MARTRRKISPFRTDADPLPAVGQKRYRAAGYARLSVEDGGRPGSETLEGQKKLIADFIEATPGMELVCLFQDNGETGTDFRRPGFERMMDAVRRGEADCIVVKDLSRLGRNYKEAGNYLERVFPALGVRFISITDRIDSLHPERRTDSMTVPLKNLINEIYSRDISRKTASALGIRQRRGEFIGTWAPYGYSKSPADRHKLIPNPVTAPTVARIFQMRLQGISCPDIGETLNTEGVPSPARYLAEAGFCRSEACAGSVWKASKVRSILTDPVYLGHMVQGRRRQSFFDGKKRRRLPEEDWIVTENTHAPLVDGASFEAVQAIRRRAKCRGPEKGGAG